MKKGKCDTVVISGGCTTVVQPLDVSLNKPFKDHVGVEWLSFMQKSVMELDKQQEDDRNEELSNDSFASLDEEKHSGRETFRLK